MFHDHSPCEVCLPRGKRSLFNRSNWTANMYRSMMVDIVFALLDVFAGENNKASMLFAAFMSVYLILRQMKFTSEDLQALHDATKVFHRCASLCANLVLYVVDIYDISGGYL